MTPLATDSNRSSTKNRLLLENEINNENNFVVFSEKKDPESTQRSTHRRGKSTGQLSRKTYSLNNRQQINVAVDNHTPTPKGSVRKFGDINLKNQPNETRNINQYNLKSQNFINRIQLNQYMSKDGPEAYITSEPSSKVDESKVDHQSINLSNLEAEDIVEPQPIFGESNEMRLFSNTIKGKLTISILSCTNSPYLHR